jgi:quinol monooxygenase YgiN
MTSAQPIDTDIEQLFEELRVRLNANGDSSWVLPAPVTFVIADDGTIHLARVDADYTSRITPGQILSTITTERNKEEMMVTTGLIVRLTAKAGKVDELAAFLRDALPLVQDEPDTAAWLAVAIGGASFAIVDAFPDERGRQAHLDGAVAAALLTRAGELLEAPPEIEYVDVLAAKL